MNKSDASKLLAQQIIDDAHKAADEARADRDNALAAWKAAVTQSAGDDYRMLINLAQSTIAHSAQAQFEVVSDWEMKKHEAVVRIADGPDYQCTYAFRVTFALNADHKELRRVLAVASQAMRDAHYRWGSITADKPAARAKLLADDLENSESGKAVLAALVEHRKCLKAQV